MLIGMQNGMVAGVIREIIEPQRTIGCVIELSSEMFTPGQVKRNTPPQKTWIGLGILDGGPAERLAEMQALLTPVGKVEIKSNILAAKWSKLVVNAMCLGPCAIVGLTISDAVQLPGMRDLIVEIGNEAMQTGQDLGHPLEPIFGLTQADLAGSNSPAEKMFDTLAGHIGPGRGRNTVLQDFPQGSRQRSRHDQRPGGRGKRTARPRGARQRAHRRDQPADRGRNAEALARQHGPGAGARSGKMIE